MKMKRHLVAAALAVGLAGSAMGLTKTDGDVAAQAGYLLVSYAFNNNGAGQAFGQGAAGAAGGMFGFVIGKRMGAYYGAKIGGTFGSMLGPAGTILGAGLGAL